MRPPGAWWTVPQRTPTPQVKDEEESDDELDLIGADADFAEVQFAGLAAGADPRNFKQAMSCPDAQQWQAACNEEIVSLIANHTWDAVPLPPGKKAIGCGWVFKVKHNADGSIERYKARLVAKGYSQRPGFDYTEVFAPTSRPAALRLVLALSAVEDLELHSVDISSAFLQGDLDEEIYMQQPEGFAQGPPGTVLRLGRPIYGLKQAGRMWNRKLHKVLTSMGFRRLDSDRSVYIYSKDEIRIIIPVHVDDLTLASKSQAAIDQTVADLSKHFKLRNLGPTRFLLGIEITRNRPERTIHLSQHQYIVDMLERYGMDSCNSVLTPMEHGLRLSKKQGPQTEEDREFMKDKPYLNAVGSLMYLAVTTRPDIQYAVSALARFNSNPGPAHWNAVKHLLCYVKGTKDLKLVYKPDDLKELFVMYTDSAHGDCPDSGRSTGGFVVMANSGAISWSSKLQTIVALSTTEAEYIAAVDAGKEIMWMRNILSEFGYAIDTPTTLYMDNQSSISVSKNPEHHGRMKHLDLRTFWLRDTVEAGKIKPVHVPTAEMVADVLTKPLPAPKVAYCRTMMGVVP